MTQTGKSASGSARLRLAGGLLLGLFLIAALALSALGALELNRVTQYGADAATLRATLGYVRQKIKTVDAGAEVALDTMDDVRVLTIADARAEGDLETRIYWWNGALYENYCFADSPFVPQSGTLLAEAADFTIERGAAGEYIFTVELSDGSRQSLCVHRPGEEAAL